MSNFKKSFGIGIQSAVEADKNRAEIDEVFSRLNEDLYELTNGKVELERRQFTEATNPLNINALLNQEKYWAIAAHNPKTEDKPVEIAKWNQDRSGYPCRIRFGNKKFICEDSEGLVEALEELLEDPYTGEICNNLMKK